MNPTISNNSSEDKHEGWERFLAATTGSLTDLESHPIKEKKKFFKFDEE